MIRQKTEAIALAPFKELAAQLGLPYETGQGRANRLHIEGNVYFQFGDLRVELPQCTVVVEVESAGGVTNLAKYWECLESRRVEKPIKLLHVFLQKSANDYEAHLVVWRFLADRMKLALGSQWDAQCVTSRGTSEENLDSALRLFRDWLGGSADEPEGAGHNQ